MVSQLDLHRPLEHPFGQLRQQPALTGDLLLRARTREQLVDHRIREQLLDPSVETVRQRRSASASLRPPLGAELRATPAL